MGSSLGGAWRQKQLPPIEPSPRYSVGAASAAEISVSFHLALLDVRPLTRVILHDVPLLPLASSAPRADAHHFRELLGPVLVHLHTVQARSCSRGGLRAAATVTRHSDRARARRAVSASSHGRWVQQGGGHARWRSTRTASICLLCPLLQERTLLCHHGSDR